MFWTTFNTIHSDLLAIKELIYDANDYRYTFPIKEAESSEYGACTFELNGLSIKFRTAKITPTKIGQFVTLWKRIEKGPIQPFDITDSIDRFVISTRKDNRFGQFIFPKSVLCEQGVISTNNKEGKRAIRVYPPWDKTTNKQAQKTQKWQLDFFLEIPSDKPIDMERAKILYGLKS
ncbi:hypothetical protein H4V97_000996 [Flavobacterium sp. CG_23.5]|uniref:MepB family protein n=1 Tax=unclassified Flavobacterium TaxID=196869 RepID=UPI0018C9F2A1|nr:MULTISPECIES: MepB family protein [unclassified Flavobacterium]MBG6111479.1 hypothetical protein [Flavobacterium sp. CG_9.10]MBP2282678.1 hypothetical protein [Flavobacterium sp. CG_23.5]